LLERDELRESLRLPDNGSSPMVFQYNPLDYLIETNDDGELLVTICRLDTTAPKLRYCIHDLGCVRRFDEVRRALGAGGVTPASLSEDWIDLPLLFHYGRSDATVAFYGANLPVDGGARGVCCLPAQSQ